MVDLLAGPGSSTPLKVRETAEGEVYVENLKEGAVMSQEDIFK